MSHLKTLLYHNTDYDSCFLMNKIKEDIEKYTNSYWQNMKILCTESQTGLPPFEH